MGHFQKMSPFEIARLKKTNLLKSSYLLNDQNKWYFLNNILKYAILMALYENIIDKFSTDGALFSLSCYQSQENFLTIKRPNV
jgi:hypothetical protein